MPKSEKFLKAFLTTLNYNTPMCKKTQKKNVDPDQESVVSFFFLFSWSKQSLVETLRVIYVWMHYSEALPRVLRPHARFFFALRDAQLRPGGWPSSLMRHVHFKQPARADICETKIKPSQNVGDQNSKPGAIWQISIRREGSATIRGCQILPGTGQEKPVWNHTAALTPLLYKNKCRANTSQLLLHI